MPNVISLNTVPTLVAVTNHHRPQPSVAPVLQISIQPAPSADGAPTAAGTPATSIKAQVPANAQPSSHAVPQGSAPSVAGSSVQADVGPDGPWYAIMKGQSIGVFCNWYVSLFAYFIQFSQMA